MGKVVTIAAAVAVVTVITVATGGSGFFASASAFTSSTLGVGTITGAVIAGATIGAALGGLSVALTPDVPKSNDETVNRLNKDLNPEAFRKIVFGETVAPSDIRYWESHGADNEKYDEVIAVATHKITAFGDLYIDDELIPFSGTAATGRLAGNLERHTVVEGSGSVGPQAGDGSLWDPQGVPATKMTGLAYYVVKYTYDKDKFPNGYSTRYTQIVKGAPVYDPRLDTTRGGTGLHRTDDQTTWEYTVSLVDIGRNPALQILWYLLGWRIDGELVAGMGVDPDDIDFASFITAANDCDSEGYYCDVALSTGDPHERNLSIIAAAAGGRVLDTGGRFRFHVATDDTAVVSATFSEDDIVGPIEWVPKLPMRSQYNSVAGQFVDAAALYQPRSYPKQIDASYETSDGFKRTVVANYYGVHDHQQAQKLAHMLLQRSRFQGGFRAVFNYKAMLVKNWDIVTLDFAQFGWTAEKFRVIAQDITVDGVIVLTLRQEDTSIFTPSTPITLPGVSSGNALDFAGKIPLTGLTLIPLSVQTDGVTTADAIDVSWADPGFLVHHTDIQYKRTADPTWLPGPTAVPAGELSATITPLGPNTSYNIRARHVSMFGVDGDWAQDTATTGENTLIGAGGTDLVTAEMDARTHLIFPGVSVDGARIEVPDNDAWDFGLNEAGSWECWAYIEDMATPNDVLLGKNFTGGVGPLGWGLDIVNGGLLRIFVNTGTGGTTMTHQVALSSKRWYHIALTRATNGDFITYVNGIPSTTAFNSSADLSNTQPLQFGVRVNTIDELQGKMRDIRAWSTVRTEQEIRDNMLALLKGTETGLVGFWPMDEGDGTVVHNKGSLGSNGNGEITDTAITWGGFVGTGIATEGAYPLVPADSVEAYWPLETLTGKDFSGNGRDLIELGGGETVVRGASGNCLNFPGGLTSGIEAMSDADAATFESKMWMCALFKSKDTSNVSSNGQRILSRDHSDYWSIRVRQDQAYPQDIQFSVGDVATNFASADAVGAVPDGDTWVFVFMQYDDAADTVQAWYGTLGGELIKVLDSTSTITLLTANTRPIAIGANTEDTLNRGNDSFTGLIDEVILGSGNLSEEQVRALFQQPGIFKGTGADEPGSTYGAPPGSTVGGIEPINTIQEAHTYVIFPGPTVDGARIDIPDDPAWDMGASEAMTIECWVYLETLTGAQCFVGKGFGATGPGWGLRHLGSGNVQAWLGNGTTTPQITVTGALAAKQWYHLAMVRTTGGDLSLYIDGKLQDGTANDATDLSNASALQLGARVNTTDELQGKMREVRIWSVARTQSEIQDNMLVDLTGSETNLLGLWPLNEGTGKTVFQWGPTADSDGTFQTDGLAWGGAVGTGLPNVEVALTDTGDLSYGVGVDQGDGTIRKFGHGPVYISGRDGDTLTFVNPYDVAPSVSFIRGGAGFDGTGLSNTAKQQPDIQALNITATQFLVSAKVKETASGITNETDGDGTGTEVAWHSGNGPTDPDWQAGKENASEAWNDTYTWKYDITGSGVISVEFYTNTGSGWVLRGDATHYGTYLGALKSIYIDGLTTNGSGEEYGMDVFTSTGPTLSDVVNVTWERATAPSSVTATPAGANDVTFRVEANVE